MKRILLLIIILISNVSATYISGDIFIYENGVTRFNLETDVPLDIEGLTFVNNKITGTTELLSNKQAGVWTFSINFGKYDNILLDINLPANLDSITSISGIKNAIDIENKIITLIGPGTLDFTLSYKLKETKDYSLFIWILILLVILTIYVLLKKSRRKRERLKYILPLVSEQEQKIIDLLMKMPMRQKELRKKLEIPKASFSRYMINLEKKKLIIREGEGKNKVVRLK
jgi:uncharacterized membrane protein